jgi:hypothetical protein
MGYFTKKPRRRRWGAEIAIAERRQASALRAVWSAVPISPPTTSGRRSEQFLRFALGAIDPVSNEQVGLFCGSDTFEHPEHLDGEVLVKFREIYGWFNQNLQVPDIDEPRSVFWFRSGSRECITQIWRLVKLFREQGIPVWLMRTRRPGKIVYEDEHQVAAVSFTDAAKRERTF